MSPDPGDLQVDLCSTLVLFMSCMAVFIPSTVLLTIVASCVYSLSAITVTFVVAVIAMDLACFLQPFALCKMHVNCALQTSSYLQTQ
jgi:hypothetical protein